MSYRNSCIVVSTLGICALLGNPQAAMADEALVKRFLEEAPRKWKEYETIVLGVDVRGESVTTFPNSPEEMTIHLSYRIVLDSDGKLAIQESGEEGTKGSDTVRVSNPRYRFVLERTSGSKEGFAITDVSYQNPNSKDSALRSGTNLGKGIRLLYLFDLSEIADTDDFQVKNAREIEQDGKHFVEIEYEYRISNPKTSQERLPKAYSGTILFSPEYYWAIVKATIKMADDPAEEVSRVEIEHRLDRSLRDVPVILETQHRLYDMKGNLWRSNIWKSEWREFTGGDKAFTLSAYGFPEPASSQPGKRRPWLLYITTVLLVVCIALLAYRRYQG